MTAFPRKHGTRIGRGLVATLTLMLEGCLTSRCKPSVLPTGGTVASCCGAGGDTRGYYWTGSSCAANTHCHCDARPARPQWDTRAECEEAHRGCPPPANR